MCCRCSDDFLALEVFIRNPFFAASSLLGTVVVERVARQRPVWGADPVRGFAAVHPRHNSLSQHRSFLHACLCVAFARPVVVEGSRGEDRAGSGLICLLRVNNQDPRCTNSPLTLSASCGIIASRSLATAQVALVGQQGLQVLIKAEKRSRIRAILGGKRGCECD